MSSIQAAGGAENGRRGLLLAPLGIILCLMRCWSARQLVALLLAVCAAAGMGLSVAQASAMSARMTTISRMDISADGVCENCPDQSSDSGMNAVACGTVCSAAVPAALPTALPLPSCAKALSLLPADRLLRGRALPPDPYPPRTSDIG